MKGNYIYYSDSDIFYSAQTGIALYIILIGTSAGNDVVATIFIILFFPPFFFSSFATFSQRRSARIKKLVLKKLIRAPNNLGLDPFPDPIGHFGAPGGHFGFRGL